MDTPALPPAPIAVTRAIGSEDQLADRPIRLSIDSSGPGRLSVLVIGDTPQAFASRFTVVVSAAGNRSVHGGNAQLQGGIRTELSRIKVGVPKDGRWSVTLQVEGPPAYSVSETSDARR